MTDERKLLQINPDPIRLVDAAVRDVWFRPRGWRCHHEDGRGRCTSRETRGYHAPGAPATEAAHYCERHHPKGAR